MMNETRTASNKLLSTSDDQPRWAPLRNGEPRGTTSSSYEKRAIESEIKCKCGNGNMEPQEASSVHPRQKKKSNVVSLEAFLIFPAEYAIYMSRLVTIMI